MTHLNIVSFDIPFPANYGGVIDVFYKIKSLHQQGVKIYLHTFQYGKRKPAIELERYCEKVYYYPRSIFSLSLKPFIVSSRADKSLLKNLQSNPYPILFEALHCCYFLNHSSLSKRMKIVRMHNIEHDYYKLLLKGEESYFKKLYLYIESYLLKRFEPILTCADAILAISDKDYVELKSRYGDKVKMISPFHAHQDVDIDLRLGDFAFYHGKLSVNENHVAAMFLVTEVMPHSRSSLIIAGDGAKESLKKAIQLSHNTRLIEGLSPADIDGYIKEAQVNLLPTFQPTGIKLKLVNCLFLGKHLLANRAMVTTKNLEDLMYLAEDGKETAKSLDILMQKNFLQEDLDKRKRVVKSNFSNESSAKEIIDLLKD